MDIDARAFGHMEGKVNALQEMMQEQNKVLAKQNEVLENMGKKIDEMQETLSETKGGWKTILWLGGSAVGITSFITWLMAHLTFKG